MHTCSRESLVFMGILKGRSFVLSKSLQDLGDGSRALFVRGFILRCLRVACTFQSTFGHLLGVGV